VLLPLHLCGNRLTPCGRRVQQQSGGSQEATPHRPIAVSRAARLLLPKERAASPQRWDPRQPTDQRDQCQRRAKRRQPPPRSPSESEGYTPTSDRGHIRTPPDLGGWRLGSPPQRSAMHADRGGSAFACVSTYAEGRLVFSACRHN
jgi:hypothetical protein